MSSGRKTNDGTLLAGSVGITKRRNPGLGEIPFGKHAAPKRTRRVNAVEEYEESPFSESSDKDRYLITYADLITLLLGLFIMLYTSSNLDLQKYENILGAIGNVFGNDVKSLPTKVNAEIISPNSFKNIREEVENLITTNNYSSAIKLEENSRGITIHILEEIVFPSGSAELKKGSLMVLSQLASILRKLPNDIRIEGHTDNVPINTAAFPSNWHLSVARALNTAYYLVNIEKLSADKVSIVGYSEYKPIDSNETPAGRATNRRVDIVITKQ